MKINPIMIYSLGTSMPSSDKENKKSIKSEALNLYSYPKEYYVSFRGGNSLELQKTVAQIQKNKAAFPPDIEKMALEEISKGNPHNKKLVDIHKEKYRELNDCDSLEELKFFYPEFSEVKSIDENEIPYNKGSLIDKFLNGEIKTKNGELFLNPKKDLSLQLIQMYWGDCLSLNDISEACEHNFSATMQKLNIPTMTPLYGQYLKLSDEDANKAITEAAARNRSLNEGSLKRKGIPLSEEHKRKISEGLRKYYKEHPNLGFTQTEENASYFSRNPYQSEVFSQILIRAWNYSDAKSIRKALARHMKKTEKEINEELLKNPAQAVNLKEFWSKNKWAREKWATCMTKSWDRQKVLEKMGLIYEPKKFFPILGRTQTKKFAEILKTYTDDYSGMEIKDIEDMLSLAIPNEKDSQPYNAYALKKLFIDGAPVIIQKGLDFPCYLIPSIINHIFDIQLQRSKKIPYLSSESQNVVNDMQKIKDAIDTDFLDKYEAHKTEEDLPKVFDIYINVAIKCLTSDSKEIRNIFEKICNHCLVKQKKLSTEEIEDSLQELNKASTKKNVVVYK